MFFFLANIMHIFHYLKVGLSVLLSFIGFKMLAHKWLLEFGFQTYHSLIIIVSILTLSILASLAFPAQKVNFSKAE
jgi:tellurite resistance protein TerC